MKRYKFSLLYILVILVTTPFHLQIERFIVARSGLSFLNYLLLGLLAACFAVALLHTLSAAKSDSFAALLLAGGVVAYFLFQRRIFLHPSRFGLFLHIAEFFLLGFILAKENRKSSSWWPYPILLGTAFAFEFIQKFLPARTFDWNDIWINAIAGLAGLVAGIL